MADARIERIFRYPVKGMAPQVLAETTLTPGETIAFDRAYAIENGQGRFDPANPRHLPKINFVMLMRDEKLATLETEFDQDTQTLTILRQGKQVARGQLSMPIGRTMIEQFLAAYMAGSLRGAPRIVSAPGHAFTDVAVKCLHIVNLASVRELSRLAGRPVDPLRFRPNLIVDGLDPWAELKWLDRELAVGDARLAVIDRTERCDATNVDPVSGARDMAIPSLLRREFGHSDFGVYAKVVTGGRIRPDDRLSVI